MKHLRLKKAFVAFFLASTIFIFPSISGFAKPQNSVNVIHHSDSAKVSKDNTATIHIEPKGKSQTKKASNSMAYNIIYYLILKFIELNPLTHTR